MEPYFKRIVLTEDSNFLVIASDGLFDVCDDQEAVDEVKDEKDGAKMAEKLTQYAIDNDSSDNILVLIANFNWLQFITLEKNNQNKYKKKI